MRFLKKPYVYAIIFSITLVSISGYLLLDTFVIAHYISDISTTPYETVKIDTQTIISSNEYKDDNIQITIETIWQYDTTIYIADIQLSSLDYLKTAFAKEVFGTNIKEKTSSIASRKNAILAINGDSYGANTTGYVIKNGVMYRENVRSDSEYDDLVIYEDGTFEIINETKVSATDLLNLGVVQLFSFGPTLIQNEKIVVSSQDEVGKAMASNPRTAIGIIDDLHYIFVVADGRTEESVGLSLLELANIMHSYDCELAYNLDGGGSSSLYFNGELINKPTTNGQRISERSVSDIVYIGYES